MEVKRIETIISKKENVNEFLLEVMQKANLIDTQSGEVLKLPSFYSLSMKLKNYIIELLKNTNHLFLNKTNKKILFNYLNKKDDYYKYAFFNEENMSFYGLSSFKTYYMAKVEILELIDMIETISKEYLGMPLFSGRNVDNPNIFSVYAYLIDQGFVKIASIKYLEKDSINKHFIEFDISLKMLECAIYNHSFENGLSLTSNMSLLDVVVMPKNKTKEGVMDLCKEIKNHLSSFNVEVDNSNYNFGYRSVKYDLEGVPLKIVVNVVEKNFHIYIYDKVCDIKKEVELSNIQKEVSIMLRKRNSQLFKMCSKRIDEKSAFVVKGNELKENGISLLPWCNNLDCLNIDLNTHAAFVPFHQILASNDCYFCSSLGQIYIKVGKILNNF